MATRCMYLAIFSAVLGMLQYGFGVGVINAPQERIEDFISHSFRTRYDNNISESTANLCFSLAVTATIIGGLIGALAGGPVADNYGRKRGLILAQIPSMAGSVMMGLCKVSNSFEMLLIGRFAFGVACGLFTALSPMYVSEIAPVRIRGALGTINQLAVTSGILISQVFGLHVVLGTSNGWPVLLSLAAVPSVLQIVILPFMPESPNFLINTKQDMEAGTKSLKRLHGDNDDIRNLINQVRGDDNESLGIGDLFKNKAFQLPLFVCICLHLSQQLSGMVAIFYYSTTFFQSAGISSDTSQYATLGVGGIMVSMTLVTVPLMDKIGRRVLHLTGLVGIVACSIGITVALSYVCTGNDCQDASSNGTGVFLIIATLTFVAFFALGPGSIPWMAASEMFTQNVRGPATSVCVFVNWLGNLIVGLVFPRLQLLINNYSFVPFLIITAVLFVILFIYFPETKGQSPTEIQLIFQQPGAWKLPIGFKSQQKKYRQESILDPHTVNTSYGSTTLDTRA